MDLNIRPAGSRDYASTRNLVHDAFTPEDVVSFLDALRADGCVLGEWIAENESGIVGHVVFSRVWLERPDGDRQPAAFLTPLAVRPDMQRSGIGTQLMEYALEALESRGETLFFVVGHPEYYPRAGFRSDTASAVVSPWPGNPAFMARGDVVPEGRLILPSVIADAH